SGVFTAHTATAESADLAFLTRNAGTLTEKLRILGNGNVGVGTSTPTATLHIVRRAGRATGTITSLGTAVTGVGTIFTNEVVVGDTIQVGSLTATVASITDSTHLTLSAGFSHDVIVASNFSLNPTNNIARFTAIGSTDSLLVTANQGITLNNDNTTAVLDSTNLLANADFATNDFTGWTAGGSWSASTGAAVYTATNAAIASAAGVSITNRGTGFVVGDVLTLATGSGDAQITVATVSSGKVLTFTLSNAGTAYNDTMTGTATGGTGTGLTFAVTQVVAGNTLTQTASSSLISGESYQLTLVKSGTTQGAVTISIGGNTLATAEKLSAGTQTYTFTAGSNNALTITPTSDFNGTLDTFTLKHFENSVSPFISFKNSAGTTALEMRTSGFTNTFIGLSSGKRNTTGFNNSALGVSALVNNSGGVRNTAIGFQALLTNSVGINNTAVGSAALQANTIGSANSAFGQNALAANTTGGGNSAFGQLALQANTTGAGNVAFGASALQNNTSGANNAAFGGGALASNTTGVSNTALGVGSLTVNTIGASNIAVGVNALSANSTGGSNTAVGVSALLSNITGTSNNAFGLQALQANTTGINNTAIGLQSLILNTTGSNNSSLGDQASRWNNSATNTVAIGYNTAGSVAAAAFNAQGYTVVGYQAGGSFGTGASYNTLLGYQAGYGITTGSNNIWIGTATSSTGIANLTTGNQNILIGNNISLASTTANGQLNIGNIIFGTSVTGTGATVSSGSIGIGTSSPTTQFQTTGSVRFSNFGAGTLSVDAVGNLITSSDERLKNIQGSFSAGLAQIQQLTPILYTWKTETGFDTTNTYAGFSAQNVQAAIPQAVGQDSHGFLTLQDRPILAATVNAIKDIGSITGIFKDGLITWLGSANNGITRMFAGEVDTNKLCVGNTCVTEAQLQQLLQAQNGIGSTPPINTTPSSDATSTQNDASSTPIIIDTEVSTSSSE
ncbi:MAG: hypothetical protein JWO50_231, partial [Candidatus Kaiserbacteria bacterium]|nr:hypothetical protein [Candidatus Kaiserbacteria bacterium]